MEKSLTFYKSMYRLTNEERLTKRFSELSRVTLL